MRLTHFSAVPERRARAAVLDDIFPKYVFIPLFIIFAAACLVLTGCSDDEIAAPDETTGGSTTISSPPFIDVWEPILGHGRFIGINTLIVPATPILPGVEFSFQWDSDISAPYLSPIMFRYGWDIEDFEDDDEWSGPWSPNTTVSEPRSFNSGIHILYVEARGISGQVTRARVELEVIPFTRERDLLWIDDYLLGGYVPAMTNPSEAEHDEFWTGICSRAPGFDQARDIYEADKYNLYDPVPLEILADYRNVVWTYSSSMHTCWKNTIVFDPAPQNSSNMFMPDNFRMFLAAGGSALTCGRTDREGGLSEIFPYEPLYPSSVLDNLSPYDFDRKRAKYSLAHDDYYVTVIDKVIGVFRSDLPNGVIRSYERDAMTMALRSEGALDLDLPDTLTLDESVTCPYCFFNPHTQGFTYIEAYDPAYYMEHINAQSHPCFTPTYRMRTYNILSPLNDAAIALRGTLVSGGYAGYYSQCEPHRQIPHDSFHFGFPLWFIDHSQVRRITDTIFEEWEIR